MMSPASVKFDLNNSSFLTDNSTLSGKVGMKRWHRLPVKGSVANLLKVDLTTSGVLYARLVAFCIKAIEGNRINLVPMSYGGYGWDLIPTAEDVAEYEDLIRALIQSNWVSASGSRARVQARYIMDECLNQLCSTHAQTIKATLPAIKMSNNAELVWSYSIGARRKTGGRLAILLQPHEDGNVTISCALLKDSGMWKLLMTDSSEAEYEQMLMSLADITSLEPRYLNELLCYEAARIEHVWKDNSVAYFEGYGSGGESTIAKFYADDALPTFNEINANSDHIVNLLGPLGERLNKMGIDIMTPTGLLKPSRARARLSRGSSTSGLLSKDNLGLTANLSIDGVPVNEEDLKHLRVSSIPFVKVAGKWILLDRENLQRTLTSLAQIDVLTPAELLTSEHFEDIELDSAVFMQGIESMKEVPIPGGFIGQLRPYQKKGLNWLNWLEDNQLSGILADDMGLGKTCQVIAHLLNKVDTSASPTLIVCPVTLVENWRREFEKFAPSLRVHVHYGSNRQPLCSSKFDVVITSYALLGDKTLQETQWQRLILDEAQYCKNPATQVAKNELPQSYPNGLT